MNRFGLSSLLVFCGFVLLWETAVLRAGVSEMILPAPSAIAAVLYDGLIAGFLWPHIWTTTSETLLGLFLGCSIGFLSGLILSENPKLRRILWPYILASQVVPKLALGPLFIIWFGFGITSTVIITALICFFPLLENTLTGLETAKREKRDLFRMLGASRLQTLIRLKIPTGLPMIMTGVRIAGVLALVGAVVGEFIGGNSGLGASIIAAQGMMDSALMFALFIVIAVLGLLVYHLTAALEYFVLRGLKRNRKPYV